MSVAPGPGSAPARSRALRPLCLLVALAGGCSETRCEDLQPAPLAGSYRGGGTLGSERLLKVQLEAHAKEVVLIYTSRDGARIRATYTVAKKLKRQP